MKRLLLPFLFLFCAPALAAPGAHGPGGEHLDAGQPHAAAGGTVPRLEASSELFELVARLHEEELSILVDRYETNEPVLGAKVEVKLGELKAAAKFHADHGDYAVDDPAFIKALAVPGEHALIFTIVAGQDSDLLDATLVVADDAAREDGHGHWLEWILVAGGALAVLGILLLVLRRRRLRPGHAAAVVLAASLAGATGSDAAPGAHGPGGEHLDQPAAAASASGLARLPDGSVNVPKSAQRRLEIRTVLAPQTEAAATVELPGRVIMDPNAGGRVQPVHGGRVEPAASGLPVAGQKVAKGQVLAWVRHHAEPFAEANQQAQLAELRAARAVAEQKLARLEGLEGTVPRKEIDAARIEARSLAERERRVAASIASREALVAPVAGVIAVANAVAGQVVEARDVLYEVVDPARLLVEAVVADVALAERIADAHLAGFPQAKLRVAGIGRSLRDGVLPVTFRAEAGRDGSAPALAVGQPVTVLALLRERVQGIVLPAEAVVRNGANEPVVWIKSGAERFIPQPVQLRPLDAARVVVTRGLGAGNRVVVRGADLIAQIR